MERTPFWFCVGLSHTKMVAGFKFYKHTEGPFQYQGAIWTASESGAPYISVPLACH